MSRILFVSRWYPYPPANGSKLRVFNLLRILATRHDVTLVSLTEPGEVAQTAPLAAFCREIHTVTRKPFDAGSTRARIAALGSRPRFVTDTWSDEFAALLRDLSTGDRCDAVIASQIDTAAYVSCFSGRPALFEEVELGLMYGQFSDAPSTAHKLRYGLTWAKHRRYLSDLLRSFSACTVASETERDLVRRIAPGSPPVEVIPNGVHLPDYQAVTAEPVPGRLIFTGAFTYTANYDAAQWFLDAVYPRLKQLTPAAHLIITGDHAGLPLPTAPDVTLTGFVPDVRPLIAGAWASVVPMRRGGGTRLKILEAMALGVPVVSTSKGAEGLDVQSDRHLLVADDPGEFAEATARLLADPELRSRLTENARRLVASRYDWQQISPGFLRLVESVLTGAAHGAGTTPLSSDIAPGGAPAA